MKILLSSLLHLVILSACSTWIPFIHTTAAQMFNPFVVDNVEHACDVSTNTGCMNGGICMSVFMPGGIPNSRCVCPPGLVRPNCDFPRQAEIHHCNHYCPENQKCLFSDDGYAYCGRPIRHPVPVFSNNNNACATSACPSDHPCGSAPCLVINGLVACLYAMSPFPTSSPAIQTTTNTISTSVCPANNPCNYNPCLSINGVQQCFCVTGTGPYCNGSALSSEYTTASSTVQTTTSSSVDATIVTVSCPVNSCNNNPCLIVNGVQQCFCVTGAGPYCNGSALSSTGQTTASSTAQTTVGAQNCPVNSCNNNPCLIVNGVQQCFCVTGTGPNCDQGTTTTASSVNSCSPSPCLNNQPCLVIQNQPVCFCSAEFLPPLCSSATTSPPVLGK